VNPSRAPEAVDPPDVRRGNTLAPCALPEDLREALLLFTVEGMSQIEIAQVLDCSPKAVEVRVYRARQALREALSRED